MNRTTLSILVSVSILCLCLACTPSASSSTIPDTSGPVDLSAAKSATKKTAPAVSPTPLAGLPVIDSFYADPAIIIEGGMSNLNWEVSNATAISISPNVGSVDPMGSQQVAPATSTEFKITASNAKGAVTALATVMIQKKYSFLSPVVLTLNIRPRIISENSTCQLSWNIFGADSISMEYGSGVGNTVISTRMASAGKMNVIPAYTASASTNPITVSNTNYTVRATNIGGTTVASTEVTAMRTAIIPKPGIPMVFDNMTVMAITVLPIIRYFSAEPYTIIRGNQTTLTWEVAQATKVLLNGAQVPVTGSQVVSPGGESTYTLSASNEYWTNTKTVTVRVLNYNPDWFKPVIR